jgi:hypothetical protein
MIRYKFELKYVLCFGLLGMPAMTFLFKNKSNIFLHVILLATYWIRMCSYFQSEDKRQVMHGFWVKPVRIVYTRYIKSVCLEI